MKLATWNVNSIRARLERVLAWLDERKPDVLCMQELKVEEEDFPADAFRERGYHVAHACQKTYNGVAIVARAPLADVACGLDDGIEDPQARLVGATVNGVRVLSAYVPNGQTVGSDKYEYKLKWLARLRDYLDKHARADQPLVLCGDFNVAPEARDVYDPPGWENETLYHVDARAALERVRAWGLVDTFRLHHQEAGAYSWWDYRMLSFQHGKGLRIDHVFATEPLARRCAGAWIDREARKGKQPSDHAPVFAEFSE
ncbi:MAG TPA: exodeoxyribonuclease III [Polyangia bacterium]|nr:exodeoxyribonuclease III [Polyangia bacterium]